MKAKQFKSKFSDLKVNVFETGWCSIEQENGVCISIGVPPNARMDLILKAIKYVEEHKNETSQNKRR